jgi:hypothetical protein
VEAWWELLARLVVAAVAVEQIHQWLIVPLHIGLLPVVVAAVVVLDLRLALVVLAVVAAQ